jgi:nicotinamidase-related amidase
MKALLIIDMQAGSFLPATPRLDAENVIDRINQLSKKFRESGNLVIFIQHDGSRENAFRPGSDEWKILPMLNMEEGDFVVSKTANDAFYKSELDSILKTQNVDELYITGCATDFCVDATVRSGLAHDYNVCVVKDGHTTADRPHLTAQQVIDHHNWLWENMIPTAGKIRVNSTSKLLGDVY